MNIAIEYCLRFCEDVLRRLILRDCLYQQKDIPEMELHLPFTRILISKNRGKKKTIG